MSRKVIASGRDSTRYSHRCCKPTRVNGNVSCDRARGILSFVLLQRPGYLCLCFFLSFVIVSHALREFRMQSCASLQPVPSTLLSKSQTSYRMKITKPARHHPLRHVMHSLASSSHHPHSPHYPLRPHHISLHLQDSKTDFSCSRR